MIEQQLIEAIAFVLAGFNLCFYCVYLPSLVRQEQWKN